MRILAIACVVVHIASARVAWAENVVVAARDAALVAALGDALAPQQVIAVEDTAPTSVGELTGASRQLVARENAAAAIWLIHDGTITTLVAYDRDADRVLIRTEPYTPPLDDAQAAVIARSARAMLRALAVDEESLPQPVPIPVVAKPKAEPATSDDGGARRSLRLTGDDEQCPTDARRHLAPAYAWHCARSRDGARAGHQRHQFRRHHRRPLVRSRRAIAARRRAGNDDRT